jgi:hypothetical protein
MASSPISCRSLAKACSSESLQARLISRGTPNVYRNRLSRALAEKMFRRVKKMADIWMNSLNNACRLVQGQVIPIDEMNPMKSIVQLANVFYKLEPQR